MKNQWPGILVVVAYFLTSLVYNAVVPLWETPDEVGHFGYVEVQFEDQFLLRGY